MAIYTNKFTIEMNDVARIVFIDERAPAAQGLPMASSTAVEVIMTIDNLKSLGVVITEAIRKRESKL